MRTRLYEIKSFTGKPSLRYQFKSGDPVDTGLKWVLVLGRILGVSPISIWPVTGAGCFHFRWLSLSTLHTLFLTCIILAAYLPGLWKGIVNATEFPSLGVISGHAYNLGIIAVYFHWLMNVPEIFNLLHCWSATMKKINLSTVDKAFPRFCLGMSLLMIGGCFAESFFHMVYNIQKHAPTWKGKTLIEKIYRNSIADFPKYVKHFTPVTSIILIYSYKVGIYNWTFAELFGIVLCRSISHKFREIGEEIQFTLSEIESHELTSDTPKFKTGAFIEKSSKSILLDVDMQLEESTLPKKETFWKDTRMKILAMCDLSEQVTKLVAPIVMICYGHNLLVLIGHIIRFLYESKFADTVFVYVSIFQYTMRVALITYYAAEVYHSTECILEAIERCPDSIYSPVAYRLERMLKRRPVGVSLLGIVTITRNIYQAIISFMFTAEIALLQAKSAGAGR